MLRSAHCAIPDCATCPTRDHSVFSDLRPMEISTVSTAKGCRTYSKGELIFFADQTPRGLFCVHRGTIKIYKVGRDGREQIMRLVNPGDIIGYRSLISGGKYETFAAPIDDAVICHIPKDAFFSIMTESFDLSSRMMTLLADELRAAEEKIVEMAQKPVRERIAETLLLLKETYGVEKDQKTLSIKLTRIELANIVGTAPESASRILSKLKEENIIDMRGRKLMIIDHDALTEVANLSD